MNNNPAPPGSIGSTAWHSGTNAGGDDTQQGNRRVSSLYRGGEAGLPQRGSSISPSDHVVSRRGFLDSRISSEGAAFGASTSIGPRARLPGRPHGLYDDDQNTGSERKRRLTQPDSPGRRTPAVFTPPTPETRSTPGLSINNPILIPSSPSTFSPMVDTWRGSASPSSVPRSMNPLGTANQPSAFSPDGNRQSDIVLPPWQPDSDVTSCPVCGKQFTFFYRKHHCRKCGRVVCANCSPHRITIPRQFIVHPPSDSPYTDPTLVDLTGDYNEASSPLGRNHLGGGEEVRVCNPCVPDPNFSPPPQPFEPLRRQSQTNSRPSIHPLRSGQPSRPRDSHVNRPSPFFDVFTESRTVYHNRTSVSDLFPPPVSSTYHPQGPQYPVRMPGQSRHQHSSSASTVPGHRPNTSSTHPLPASPPPPPPPRREIPEEDECPVCGEELPPRGPNGSTTAREEHVQECIAGHFSGSTSSPPSALTAASSAAIQASSATSGDAQSTSTSLPALLSRNFSNSSPAPSGLSGGPSRPRRATASNRMLIYEATEKDCVGEDGGVQECVICFEEFEAGDEMGRLVCLCKFHKACIRKWWETKGPGSCPTHQLHD